MSEKYTVASSLATVNEMLVGELMSLSQDDVSSEELDKRIKRSEAIANISSKIIEVNKTVIAAVKCENEYGRGRVDAIGINSSNKNE